MNLLKTILILSITITSAILGLAIVSYFICLLTGNLDVYSSTFSSSLIMIIIIFWCASIMVYMLWSAREAARIHKEEQKE